MGFWRLKMVYGDDKAKFIKTAEKFLHTKESGYYTLACANVDGFKLLSDQYGVRAGEEVLEHIETCVSTCMSKIGGICMRTSLDEFMMIYPREYEGSDTLIQNYNDAVTPECIPRRISMRIGRYHVRNRNEDVTLMMYRAKIAADSIRGNYENNIGVYNESMRNELLHRQQITSNMEDALRHRQFEIWLQPQHNHATGAIIGAEALVRWKKNGEFIPPGEFIEIFEKNGFIYKLDQYVLNETCKLLRRWMDEGRNLVPVSVNISRRDVIHEGFVECFTSIIQSYDIPIDLIRLEITESAFSSADETIIERISRLIEMGYVVEIDDFGSGYSSLNTLKDVKAAAIKLDMHFFDKTDNNERAGNIVESVVRMARWLGMSVIAEGVERKTEADFLLSIGCRYIQGYYYAKPMPIKDYEAYADKHEKEENLVVAEIVETFDNSKFWDPESMDTLIFNSYVGGAYIFEYHNRSTEILRVNDQYYKQFNGMIPRGTELDDARISGYIDDENRQNLFDTIEAATETHKEKTCRLKIADDTRTEYIDVTMRVLARKDSHFLLYGAVTNVTAAQKAQQQEQERASQLETILNSMKGGILASVYPDMESAKLLFCNDGLYKMHGYTKEQFEKEVGVVGKLIYEEDLAMVDENVRALLKDKKSRMYEHRARKRDGSIIWVRMANSVVSMEGVEGDVIIGIVKDITNEKGEK